MDKSIRPAVATVWPGTRYYICELHMQRKLAHDVGRLPDIHVVRGALLERAFYSFSEWDAFVDAVRHEHVKAPLPAAARVHQDQRPRHPRPARQPPDRRPALQRRGRVDDLHGRPRAAA
jgi:hypothetical protein